MCLGLRGFATGGGDVVGCDARVFFFIVGLDCGEDGVWVCFDFVCYGVPDRLQVWLIFGSGL